MTKVDMSRWLITLLVAGFFGIASGAERREVLPFAEFGDRNATTQAVVTTLIDSFKSTWAAQDTDGHLELFSQDAEWINAYARMFRGKEELGVFLRTRLFPSFDSEVSREEIRNARIISIRYLNDNAAIIHLYTDGRRGPSAIEGQAMRRTHIHLVTEKGENQWQIVHTAIMDARD